MESDDPEVAPMHLAYAATFDPSVYVRCVPRDGCPRSGHHVFHGAQAAARAATCEFCTPPPPTAPPPGVALPASAAGVRALQRQHAPAAASAAHDAALAATARWCATSDVYRKMPPPAVVRKLAERRVRLWEAGDAVRAGFSVCGMQQLWRESRDGSELHNYQMEAGELPTTTSRSARRRKRRRSARARAAFAEAAEGGADAAADGVPPAVVDAHRRAAKLTAVQELRRARQALDTADLGMVSDAAAALPALDALHPPHVATGPEYSPPEEPPDLQRAPPSWGDNADEVRRWREDQRRVLRRAPRLSAGHVDWWRWEHIRDLDVPSWRMWMNRGLAGRCHSRTTAFLASGSVFALHKDDPLAREEREKSGEPLRVRPLGVGSVLVRLASAHALGQVGADAREVMARCDAAFSRELASFADDCGAGTAAAHVPRVFDEYCTELSKVGLVVQDSKTRYVRHPDDSESELRAVREKLAPGGFWTPADDPVQDGAVYLGAPISHYPEWMTGALGRRREAHATLLERIASFGTSGYGCHHGTMRLLVVCAVRRTGFLSRMMPPSELDRFLEAVDAANISAAFLLLGLDACLRPVYTVHRGYNRSDEYARGFWRSESGLAAVRGPCGVLFCAIGCPAKADMGSRGSCCLICLHEQHEQDAPTDPTAPCVRCEGILRPPVALLSYYDFTAASRQALFDVLGTKSRANPNSPGAVEGASMVTVSVNYPLPLLKLQLAHVMEKLDFPHLGLPPLLLDFHGNVNVPDGERAFENARQKATGDLHLIGLPMTLTLEIIEVGSKETSGAIHKLSFWFSTFAITAAQDEDGHVNLRMSAMHPSDLTDAGIDKSRWPHKPLYRQYAAYNELGARRLLRRNRRHMLPGASRHVLLEGSKHWGSTAAIASIGYYLERLAPAGAPAGTEPFMHHKLNRANCGYKWRSILLQEERARDKFLQELEAAKRERDDLTYKKELEQLYWMMRGPVRRAWAAKEQNYYMDMDRRLNGEDFAACRKHALRGVEEVEPEFTSEREWVQWCHSTYPKRAVDEMKEKIKQLSQKVERMERRKYNYM
eukprot:jgi/Tetstr1/460366/TSEL_005665.t1